MKPLSPMRLPAGAGHATARAYLMTHDQRVTRIDRMRPDQLNLLWKAGMELQGMVSLFGGPQAKDELVNAIADMEFPDAARAREIYHGWVLSGQQPAIGQE